MKRFIWFCNFQFTDVSYVQMSVRCAVCIMRLLACRIAYRYQKTRLFCVELSQSDQIPLQMSPAWRVHAYCSPPIQLPKQASHNKSVMYLLFFGRGTCIQTGVLTTKLDQR